MCRTTWKALTGAEPSFLSCGSCPVSNSASRTSTKPRPVCFSILRRWLRVWGARGLLWAWDESATSATGSALHDPAWRVREMAAKVAAKHRVGDVLDALEALRQDPNPRVRQAAERGIVRIVAADS